MTPQQIAGKFQATDAHDDTAEGFAVRPATSRSKGCKVEIVLFRHWENKRRLLVLGNCANVELMLDSNVLFDNCPSNTCALEATADVAEIQTMMQKQKSAWNLTYDESIDPLSPKLAAAASYVLFRVRLFGGTLVVIARSFSIKSMPPAVAKLKSND